MLFLNVSFFFDKYSMCPFPIPFKISSQLLNYALHPFSMHQASVMHFRVRFDCFDMHFMLQGIKISTPIQWPLNRGFSFSCWLRIESLPRNGAVNLFSFLSENGRGCLAMVSKDKILYEV